MLSASNYLTDVAYNLSDQVACDPVTDLLVQFRVHVTGSSFLD